MIFMLLVTHKSEIRILCLMKPTIAKCFQICQLFLITFFFCSNYLFIYQFFNPFRLSSWNFSKEWTWSNLPIHQTMETPHQRRNQRSIEQFLFNVIQKMFLGKYMK